MIEPFRKSCFSLGCSNFSPLLFSFNLVLEAAFWYYSSVLGLHFAALLLLWVLGSSELTNTASKLISHTWEMVLYSHALYMQSAIVACKLWFVVCLQSLSSSAWKMCCICCWSATSSEQNVPLSCQLYESVIYLSPMSRVHLETVLSIHHNAHDYACRLVHYLKVSTCL